MVLRVRMAASGDAAGECMALGGGTLAGAAGSGAMGETAPASAANAGGKMRTLGCGEDCDGSSTERLIAGRGVVLARAISTTPGLETWLKLLVARP